MRVFSGCLLFLALAAATPQDSLDLRKRYGEPDVERFTIRPGITMTAEYGADGKACVLSIEPHKDFFQDMVADETLPMDTMTSILDEVAPPSTRGKELSAPYTVVMSSSCNGGMTFADYENVRINLVYGFCLKQIVDHRATVIFKRGVCEPLMK